MLTKKLQQSKILEKAATKMLKRDEFLQNFKELANRKILKQKQKIK